VPERIPVTGMMVKYQLQDARIIPISLWNRRSITSILLLEIIVHQG